MSKNWHEGQGKTEAKERRKRRRQDGVCNRLSEGVLAHRSAGQRDGVRAHTRGIGVLGRTGKAATDRSRVVPKVQDQGGVRDESLAMAHLADLEACPHPSPEPQMKSRDRGDAEADERNKRIAGRPAIGGGEWCKTARGPSRAVAEREKLRRRAEAGNESAAALPRKLEKQSNC